MSIQILQKMIADINQIIKRDCSVWNMEGLCLVTTAPATEEIEEDVKTLSEQSKERGVRVTDQNACFVIQNDGEAEYILALHTTMDNIAIVGKLCVNQFESMIQIYERRVDRNRFFQQLLLDNMLMVDVYSQAKKMKINVHEKRIVYVVEPWKEESSIVFETMKGIYGNSTKDIVTVVDEKHIVLIKTLAKHDSYKEANDVAKMLIDTLSTEAMVRARVSYGCIFDELKDVSKCYKEANMALDVGRIFYGHKDILAYNELGIGRLIHQLPYSLCEMFLKEVFRGNAIDQFDKETLATVNAFFENDLNISETARKMYLHRNTLGYRLDKIQKTTGLDVKKFEDALTFKIALMVSDHMKFVQAQD